MTGEEILQTIQAQQGYVVRSSNITYSIGEITDRSTSLGDRIECVTPMRIIGLSDESEWESQQRLKEQFGAPRNLFKNLYYYRVEAAD
jgi:hypothetical protein